MKLASIVVLALVAVLIFVGFVRRTPEQTALGTIASKGYLSGSTYVVMPVGANRGFNTPTTVDIAEANTFELRLDGVPGVVRASFNTVKSRQYAVGQRVRVRYVRRGLPPVWQRVLVTDLTPADAP